MQSNGISIKGYSINTHLDPIPPANPRKKSPKTPKPETRKPPNKEERDIMKTLFLFRKPQQRLLYGQLKSTPAVFYMVTWLEPWGPNKFASRLESSAIINFLHLQNENTNTIITITIQGMTPWKLLHLIKLKKLSFMKSYRNFESWTV